jgi:hypothetical protein
VHQTSLHVAKMQKNDEFYTQLADIENELKHYKVWFKDKVVFCNCDDPYESNFFKYFANNFKHLGLKKLLTTSYTKSPIAGTQVPLFEMEGLKPDGKQPFKVEINGVPDSDGSGSVDLSDVQYLLKHDKNTATPLKGNGDFRSEECIELLKQADIVCTNPPFSLFREYIAQLVEYNKKFLIISNKNAITYKETFSLIKENKMWLGYRNINSDMWFLLPDDSENYEKIVDGKKVKHIMACWFTNLDTTKRHEDFVMYKKYSSETNPKYDNYDAANVDVVAEIPMDYADAMGVPITFLDKYNPDQFEILGITSGRDEFDAIPTKRYINPKQINEDGSTTNGSKANTRATLLSNKKPDGIYYAADNANGYLSILYARIVVRNKKVEK